MEATDQKSEEEHFQDIKAILEQNDVVLFMKGTQTEPQCGFSSRVAQILKFLDVPFKDIDVQKSASFKEALKKFSDWPTLPQLYIKGKFVGGCDIVCDMLQSGELQDRIASIA